MSAEDLVPAGLGKGGLRQVRHQRQHYHWDCGLACVLMCLPDDHRSHMTDNFSQVCGQEGFGRSTWTIDLAYLLKRFDVNSLFCTTTIGIQPAYNGQPFYAKVIQKDESRVLSRFEGASEAGVKVERRSVKLGEVLKHIESNGVALVLTDGGLLHCILCKANRLGAELRACLPWRSTFSGHYILVVGFDAPHQLLYYRNPSYSDRVCVMSFSDFDEARLSYGTDEDILLVAAEHLEFQAEASPLAQSTSQ